MAEGIYALNGKAATTATEVTIERGLGDLLNYYATLLKKNSFGKRIRGVTLEILVQ